MYLVDTNVWLERLLDQEKSEDVGNFLHRTPSEQLFITDFTFHSIAIVLNKLGRNKVLLDFVRDVFVDGSVSLIHLEPEDTNQIVFAIEEFKLDFDDAYQYVAAHKYSLSLVSWDSDFDLTDRGRTKPEDILK